MLDQTIETYDQVTSIQQVISTLNTTGVSWLVTISLVTVIGGCYYLHAFINRLNSHHEGLNKEVKAISRGLDKLATEIRSQQVEILARQSKGIIRTDRLEQEINKIKKQRRK